MGCISKNIFIINGSGGVGKDSFVKAVEEITDSVKNISFVDLIKDAAAVLGWDGGKTEKDRLFLSNLEQLSLHYNDLPFRYVISEAENFEFSEKEILFIHIRRPEQIDRVKNILKAKTVLVIRYDVKPIESNSADANVLNYDYDIIISNDEGIVDLHSKAEDFVRDLKNGNLKSKY